MMTINAYLLNLEINLMFADTGQEVMWYNGPGVFLLGASGRFFTQLLLHNPYPGKTF